MVRDLPGGLLVKNLPPSAGDAASIPDWKAKILHAARQLSLHTTTKPAHHNYWALTPQLKRSPRSATKIASATIKTQNSHKF